MRYELYVFDLRNKRNLRGFIDVHLIPDITSDSWDWDFRLWTQKSDWEWIVDELNLVQYTK